MQGRLHTLFLVFLLAWLPVQATALPAMSVYCLQLPGHAHAQASGAGKMDVQTHQHQHQAGDTQSHAHAHAQPPQHAHAQPAQHDHAPAHAHASDNLPCCDHHFTGVLFSSLSLPDSAAPAPMPGLPHSQRQFVPEQPTHPPSP